MRGLNLLTRQDRVVIALAAGAASLGIAAATLLVFAADSRTEWLAANSDLAVAARRCDKAANSTQRRQCLREVVAAQRATNAAPTRVADTALPAGARK